MVVYGGNPFTRGRTSPFVKNVPLPTSSLKNVTPSAGDKEGIERYLKSYYDSFKLPKRTSNNQITSHIRNISPITSHISGGLFSSTKQISYDTGQSKVGFIDKIKSGVNWFQKELPEQGEAFGGFFSGLGTGVGEGIYGVETGIIQPFTDTVQELIPTYAEGVGSIFRDAGESVKESAWGTALPAIAVIGIAIAAIMFIK